MKKQLALFLGVLLLSSCSALFQDLALDQPLDGVAPQPTHTAQRRLLVLRFLNKAPMEGAELIEQAHNDVVAAIKKTGEFHVLTQEDIDGGEDFSDGASYNTNLILRRAKEMSIAGVVGGVIEDMRIEWFGESSGVFSTVPYRATASVRLQLFDVANEKEVVSTLTEAVVNEEVTMLSEGRDLAAMEGSQGRQAVSSALQKSLSKFPQYSHRIGWSGRIAKIDARRYYINAGELTGLRPGQLLKVFGESTLVNDGKTGGILGMARGPFKGLLRVVDLVGLDAAVATSHSGSGFREQDRVEIYSPR